MNAVPFIDFCLSAITDAINLNDPQEKSAAVERLLPILSRIKEPIQLAHYRQKLAKLVHVDDRDISSALSRYNNYISKKASFNMKKTEGFALEKPRLLADHSEIEEYCLALLFRYPNLRERIPQILPEYFEHIQNRELFLKLKESDDYVTITDRLDNNLSEYLESIQNKNILTDLDKNDSFWEQDMDACILRMQKKMDKEFRG